MRAETSERTVARRPGLAISFVRSLRNVMNDSMADGVCRRGQAAYANDDWNAAGDRYSEPASSVDT